MRHAMIHFTPQVGLWQTPRFQPLEPGMVRTGNLPLLYRAVAFVCTHQATVHLHADHDFAWNNYGNNYACPVNSQNEFVHHFGLPESDPRHPAQGTDQQRGGYSAYMVQRYHEQS